MSSLLSTFLLGRAALRLPALPFGARGLKRKTLRTEGPKGWPNKSPDGWYYARALKRSNGENYISKQAQKRIDGAVKGADARAVAEKVREEPMFTVSS